MRRELSVVLLVLAVLGAMTSAYGADTKTPPVPSFQGSPGARALAMGGAFIGVADDATAAETNPAGLTILTRPEVSLHLLSQNNTDLCPGCTADSEIHPSFASYVQPWRRAVFSLYYSNGLATTTGFTDRFNEIYTFYSERTHVSLNRFGVAGAFRPIPLLSVGASVALSRLSLESTLDEVFEQSEDDQGNVLPGFFEIQDTLHSNDTSFTYNVGVVVNPGGRVSGGVVYKGARPFQSDRTLRFRSCLAPCTLADLRTLDLIVVPERRDVPVPKYVGAGLAVRPFARALLALDYSIEESQAVFISQKDQEIRAWRIGGEYMFATRNSSLFIPLRAGYSREKNPDYVSSDFFRETASSYSLGTGVVFGANQIDIAFSSGHTIATATALRADEKLRQIIVSGIRRF